MCESHKPLPFDDLCRRHSAALRAYIEQRLRRMNAPVDLVDAVEQDALIAAWRKLDKFDAERGTEFQAWVKGFAHFAVLDAVRSWRRRGRLTETVTRRHSKEIEGPRAAPSDDAALPSPQLAAALDSLSAKRRDVIWRHLVEGKSLKEIAAELDMTEGAVKAAIHRGLHQLQRKLGSLPPPGE